MSYFNENNKKEADAYLEQYGIISMRMIIEENKKIPSEAKFTGQPLLDVANYIKSKELKHDIITNSAQKRIDEK